MAWSVVWYRWFRDSPGEKAGVSLAELEETRGLVREAHHSLPWKTALGSRNLWTVMGVGVAMCIRTTFSSHGSTLIW